MCLQLKPCLEVRIHDDIFQDFVSTFLSQTNVTSIGDEDGIQWALPAWVRIPSLSPIVVSLVCERNLLTKSWNISSGIRSSRHGFSCKHMLFLWIPLFLWFPGEKESFCSKNINTRYLDLYIMELQQKNVQNPCILRV